MVTQMVLVRAVGPELIGVRLLIGTGAAAADRAAAFLFMREVVSFVVDVGVVAHEEQLQEIKDVDSILLERYDRVHRSEAIDDYGCVHEARCTHAWASV